MTTINLRSANPNGLTNIQIDANFTNLDKDKVENADCVASWFLSDTITEKSEP